MRRHMRGAALSREQYRDAQLERRAEKMRFKPICFVSIPRAAREVVPFNQKPDWVSVEIECYYPSHHRGIRLPPFVKVHDDGSITPSQFDNIECDCDDQDCDGSCRVDNEYKTREYVHCFRTSRKKILKKLCNSLGRLAAETNDSCGLHVHLDVNGWTDDQFNSLVDKFERVLPLLMSIVDKSRHKNEYCRPGVGVSSRYYAINTTSRGKHGTLEIRLCHGSTDFAFISGWVDLLQWIKVTNITGPVESLDDLFEYSPPDNILNFCEKWIEYQDHDINKIKDLISQYK